MEIKIKNKDLFFIIEAIWDILDYRFKYQINQLVIANDNDDFIQKVEIDLDTLKQCYLAISTKGYGYTCNMADLLIVDLRNQIVENMVYDDDEDEYTKAAIMFQELKDNDNVIYENKCISGKTQILA